jgi:hypothetical protein
MSKSSYRPVYTESRGREKPGHPSGTLIYMSNHTNNLTIRYFAKNLAIIVGIVLIWRGIWYVLDAIDLVLFAGSPIYSALLGIIVGFFILYLPDKDLKEIEKL